jgi:hypothetical protein
MLLLDTIRNIESWMLLQHTNGEILLQLPPFQFTGATRKDFCCSFQLLLCITIPHMINITNNKKGKCVLNPCKLVVFQDNIHVSDISGNIIDIT